MKKLLVIALFIFVALGSFNYSRHTVGAQTPPPSPVTALQSSELKGELLRINNDKLTLETSDGPQEVTVPTNVSIKRNTSNALLSDIKPGDQVTVTTSSDGQVLSIESTSSKIFDTSKWLIPALIVGLIVGFIIWRMLKKANQPHIKTSVG